MKAPDHPVPSGDREMARRLCEALRLAGHEVEDTMRCAGVMFSGAIGAKRIDRSVIAIPYVAAVGVDGTCESDFVKVLRHFHNDCAIEAGT